MRSSEVNDSGVPETDESPRTLILSAIAAVAGFFVTFLIASSGISYLSKILAAAAVAVGYSAFVFFIYRSSSTRVAVVVDDHAGSHHDKLVALEEAEMFFGSSLSSADMFRLISSRVSDIFPAEANAVFLNVPPGNLKMSHAGGRNLNSLIGGTINIDNGAAGRAFSLGVPVITSEIATEETLFSVAILDGICSAVAIPLSGADGVFGVYLFYSSSTIANSEANLRLLEAIGERIAPVFRGAAELERSLSTALSDPVTDLPNERAFFMVLENQLAESHRYRDDRPLTVLSIDIKGFSEVNGAYGHAAGDELLGFAAGLIRDELRKMDFLARSMNDEFVVILPTANEKTAVEIVERIKQTFAESPFEIAEGAEVEVRLNFGWATFWQDGETPAQLLQNARLRKSQAKSEEPGKVLWFPKEYVN